MHETPISPFIPDAGGWIVHTHAPFHGYRGHFRSGLAGDGRSVGPPGTRVAHPELGRDHPEADRRTPEEGPRTPLWIGEVTPAILRGGPAWISLLMRSRGLRSFAVLRWGRLRWRLWPLPENASRRASALPRWRILRSPTASRPRGRGIALPGFPRLPETSPSTPASPRPPLSRRASSKRVPVREGFLRPGSRTA